MYWTKLWLTCWPIKRRRTRHPAQAAALSANSWRPILCRLGLITKPDHQESNQDIRK